MTRDELIADLDSATRAGDVELARAIDAKLSALEPAVDQSVTDANDARAKQRRTINDFTFGEFLKKSALASMPARAAMGGMDVIDAGAQMLSRLGGEEEAKRVDEMVKERNRLYAENRADVGQSGADVPRALGSTAAILATTKNIPAATSTLGKFASVPLTGALYGAMQPVTEGEFSKEKAKQIGLGAAVNTVATPIAAGLSRVISPAVDPAVKSLLDRGVNLTPGQIAGGGFRTAEEKAKSLPLFGGMVKSAEERATQSLNDAAWNRVLANIGQKLPKGVRGNDAVSYVDDAISENYGKIIDKIGAKPVDEKLIADLSNLGGMVSTLREDVGRQYAAIVKQKIAGRLQDGALTGEGVKAAESELGSLAARYGRSSQATDQDLAEALFQARTHLREWLARAAPEQAKALQANNKAYAEFIRPLRAAGAIGADEGVFTAAQLQNAVKASDPSKYKKAFAKGEALMQDLSAPAKAVMTPRIPNSGTADRGLAAAAPIGIYHALTTGALPMAALPAAGLAAAAYTAPGQKLMQYALARRPESAGLLAQGVREVLPPLSVGMLPLTGLLNE